MIETVEQIQALGLALLIAVIYLAVIRFLDLNEKEPLWAILLFFFLGAQMAGLIYLLLPSRLLELSLWPAVVSSSLAKFIAIAIGMAILFAVARLRGWGEVNGLMDGVVYGFAAGLGYATGEVFMKEALHSPTLLPGVEPGIFTTLWTSAVAGLSDGLFGALVGAGFGAAARGRGRSTPLYAVLGLGASLLVHAFHRWLAYGNALGGAEGLMRVWLALGIPVLLVLGIAFYALSRERRAIRDQLADEDATGAVTNEELKTLTSFGARQSLYWNALTHGRWDEWAGHKSLHDRQVQLALAKERLLGNRDETERAAIEAEIAQLRDSIHQVKQALATMPQNAKGVPSA